VSGNGIGRGSYEAWKDGNGTRTRARRRLGVGRIDLWLVGGMTEGTTMGGNIFIGNPEREIVVEVEEEGEVEEATIRPEYKRHLGLRTSRL